jgi:uncharacterized protein (DUF342 family)
VEKQNMNLLEEELVPYVEQEYDREQLEEIKKALAAKLNIAPYLKSEFHASSIREIAYGLKDGLDVSEYADSAYTWRKMREIRLGMLHGVDVSQYKNPYYSCWQMQEIRLGLEQGLDVGKYKSLMYTANRMKKMRLEMEAQPQNMTDTGVWNQIVFDFGKVYISKDEMCACMEVTDQNLLPDAETVITILKKVGIVCGIDKMRVAEIVSNNEAVGRQIPVAVGKSPQNGTDGCYVWNFKSRMDMMPGMSEDGTADFENIEWFTLVKEGQLLATYSPATPGTDGFSVKGQRLAAKQGKELPRLSGDGFKVSDDGCTYIAEMDGHVRRRRFHMQVERLLVIEEPEVTDRTINFDGSIHILGNVENQYHIFATGDIVVDGSVHSSSMESRRNILVRHGINAVAGESVIRAGGNILGGYFESAEIFAGKNIFLTSSLNSNLTANGEIVTFGDKGGIVGGRAYAEKGFCISNAGNSMGKQTRFQLGITKEIKKQYGNCEKKLSEIQKEMEKLETAVNEICAQYTETDHNTKNLLSRIADTIDTISKEKEELVLFREELQRRITRAMRSQLIIDGTLYSNVSIYFDNEKFFPQQTSHAAIKYNNSTFHVEKMDA